MTPTLRPLPTESLPFFFEPVHSEVALRLHRAARSIVAVEEARQPEREEAFDPSQLWARSRALARALAEEGVLGLALPEAYGGVAVGRPDDLDLRALCLTRELLAWADGLADTVFAMQGLGSYPITRFGSEAQRAEWLPPIARGECLAAFAITEAEAGSDVGAMRSQARRDGSGYVLDGEKTFISNAGVAGSYVVFAALEPGEKRSITAFLVRPEDPGFEFVGALPALGDHPLGTIRFSELRLGSERRLGEEGEGLKIALSTLDVFRSTVGAAAVGFARRALDESVHRARMRRQFGRPIGEQQLIQGYLAESAVEVDAARLLVLRAAWIRDTTGARISREAAMAKLFATEIAQRVIDRAVQIHGGSGVLRGAVVEQLYREIRALRIYEGTTEIQKLVIARTLLEEARDESSNVS
ncbi:MAG: acyl-CoA dehydrogenase [Deltaproteobacteria bacterium]|nr:MAG: acyl-CoA dehydrogenase [Deltaproteobacteria bacterium]